MIHFTVLVVGDDVEKQLAPFQENNMGDCPRKYMEFNETESESLREYLTKNVEMVQAPSGERFYSWDRQFKVGDIFDQKTMIPEDYKKVLVAHKDRFGTFEEFMSEWHGSEERDPEMGVYGYWENQSKYLITFCEGEEIGAEREILYPLSNNEASRGFLHDNQEGQAEFVLHLQGVREENEPKSENHGEKVQVAYQGEVRDYLESVGGDGDNTERIVRDLFCSCGEEACGSLPQNREGKGVTLQELQSSTRASTRQYLSAGCGDKLPHRAHVTGINQIGGSKWDWFQLGGRWTGFFKMKPLQLLGTNQVFFDSNGFSPAEIARLTQMRQDSPEQFEAVIKKYKGKEESIRKACDLQDLVIYPEHTVGEPGILTSKAEPGYADSARKRDIDFAGMRDEAGEKAGSNYDKMLAVIGADLEDFISWDKMREEIFPGDMEAARTAYHGQAAKKALQTAEDTDLRWNNIEDFLCTREEYIEKARAKAISTFAVLMGGKWYEKGKMGWWACVSNENADWSEEFGKLLDGISDDTLLTVVDCHI